VKRIRISYQNVYRVIGSFDG